MSRFVFQSQIGKGGAVLLALIGLSILTACTPTASANPTTVTISGAADVVPIARDSSEAFSRASGYSLEVQPVAAQLDDLRKGKIDAVLVGRELSEADLQDLRKTEIGYDAVCLLVSSRVYNGGIQQNKKPGQQGDVIVPAAKFGGLKNFSREDLASYMSNLLIKYEGENRWYYPGSFFSFEPYMDGSNYTFNPENSNVAVGSWVWNTINLSGENLSPDKFDTEVVILQKLGWPLSDLENPKLSYAYRIFETEEELISSHFSAELPEHLKPTVSSYSFDFFVRIASRRVALRALKYGFFIDALSIDGIDPLKDPQVIYNGDYPLSRKIYILTRAEPGKETQAYVDFLLSAEGQKIIADDYYLPLPVKK